MGIMKERLEPKMYLHTPPICPKPGCGCTIVIPHEDGWQCLNCMKIIYKAKDDLTKSLFSKNIN